MLYKGVFKRVIPFFLTFAAGLFITSLFIPVAAPNFNWRHHRGSSFKYREYKRLKMENRELRNEKHRLQRDLEEARRSAAVHHLELGVPPVPTAELDAPPPPPAPRKVLRYVR